MAEAATAPAPTPAAPAAPVAPEKPIAPPVKPAAKAAEAKAAPKEEQRFDSGGNPIRVKKAAPKSEPKEKEPEPEAEPEEAEDADVGSDTAGSESSGEAADESEADVESPEAGVEALGDETEIDVGDEKVPLKALKEAFAKVPEAERLHKVAQAALNVIATEKEYGVLKVFTSRHGGDGEKGYEELAQMSSRVLDDAAEYDDIPEYMAAAAVKLVQKLAALEKMSPVERELLKTKRRAETAEQRATRMDEERQAGIAIQRESDARERFAREMPEALAAGGIGATPDTMESLRLVLLESYQSNRPLTVSQGVAKLKEMYAIHRRAALGTAKTEDVPEELRLKLRDEDIAAVRGGARAIPKGPRAVGSNGTRTKLPERKMMF